MVELHTKSMQTIVSGHVVSCASSLDSPIGAIVEQMLVHVSPEFVNFALHMIHLWIKKH
jgi:hypothetical protein